jgi:hypothetical protein
VDREHHVAAVALGRQRDRGAHGRIFGRIVDDLHECLLDQDGIDIDERQVRVHVERDIVTGEPPPAPLECGIDDVLGLDPLLPRPDLLAADAGRIEQVLDVVVEPLGLVAHH